MYIRTGNKREVHIKGKNVPGRRPKQRPSEVETSWEDMRHSKKTNIVRAEGAKKRVERMSQSSTGELITESIIHHYEEFVFFSE